MYKRVELEANYQAEIRLPNINIKNIDNHPVNRDRVLIKVKNEVERARAFFFDVCKNYKGEFVLLDRLAVSIKDRLKKYRILLTNNYQDIL